MSTATISGPDIAISFEGLGEFDELIGGTQGNFLVRRPGGAAREVAVVLNHAASEWLAKELGQENTHDFRTGAVRIVGRRAIERMVERFHRLDGLIMLGAASLREDPALAEAARVALASMPAPTPAPADEHGHDEHGHDEHGHDEHEAAGHH